MLLEGSCKPYPVPTCPLIPPAPQNTHARARAPHPTLQLTDESLGALSRYTQDVLPDADDDFPLRPVPGGMASSVSGVEWDTEGGSELLTDQLGVLALAGGSEEAGDDGAEPQEQEAAGAVAPAQGALASPSEAVRRLVAARHAAQLAAAEAAGARGRCLPGRGRQGIATGGWGVGR